jgi:hypothetical protein
MPLTETLDLRLRPWRTTDTRLMAALNSPVMTEHTGGPEADEKLSQRLQRYVDPRRSARCRRLTADQHGSKVAHVDARSAALLSALLSPDLCLIRRDSWGRTAVADACGPSGDVQFHPQTGRAIVKQNDKRQPGRNDCLHHFGQPAWQVVGCTFAGHLAPSSRLTTCVGQ